MCAKVVQQPEMIIFSKHLILIQVFQPPNIQNMHFIPITTQKQLTNSQNEKGNQRIKSQKFNLPKKHSIFWFGSCSSHGQQQYLKWESMTLTYKKNLVLQPKTQPKTNHQPKLETLTIFSRPKHPYVKYQPPTQTSDFTKPKNKKP